MYILLSFTSQLFLIIAEYFILEFDLCNSSWRQKDDTGEEWLPLNFWWKTDITVGEKIDIKYK